MRAEYKSYGVTEASPQILKEILGDGCCIIGSESRLTASERVLYEAEASAEIQGNWRYQKCRMSAEEGYRQQALLAKVGNHVA